MNGIPLNKNKLFQTWLVFEIGQTVELKDLFEVWNNLFRRMLHFLCEGLFFENSNYETGTLLHLDHNIGEYNAMTKVLGVK